MALKERYYQMIMAGNLDDDDLIDSNNQVIVNDHPRKLFAKEMFKNEENSFEQWSNVDIEKRPVSNANDDPINHWEIIVRTLKLAQPEWLIIALASISALLIGTSIPIFSILFGEMYGVS